MRNLNLVVDFPELQLGVIPCKMKTLITSSIKDRFNIIQRDNEGNLIEKKATKDGILLGKTNKNWVREDGTIVESSLVHHFLVKEDGTEQEIAEFERTATLEPKLLSREFKDSFKYEKKAVIINAMDKKKPQTAKLSKKSLLKLAEYLEATNQIAICPIVLAKSFKKWVAVLSPIIKEDSFVISVDLAQEKVDITDMMSKDIDIDEVQSQSLPTLPISIEV